MKFTPRPFQIVAADHAATFLLGAAPSDKKLYAAPTGVGKSVVERLVQERLGPTCWIISPKDEILAGIMDKAELTGDHMDHSMATPIVLRNRLLEGVIRHPKYLVIDESHHHNAETYQQLDLLTGLAPAVGYTATPYRGTPRGTREFLERWGKPQWLITYKEAQDEGFISMPVFKMLPLVDDDIVEVKGGEFDVTSINAATVDRLGDCLAEGSPVLTDSGWKSIESVQITDKVWDGNTWVTHDGVICRGEKRVIEVSGIRMTPEHKVLAEKGWAEACHVGNRTPKLGQYSETGQLFLTVEPPGTSIIVDVNVAEKATSIDKIYSEVSPHNAKVAKLRRLNTEHVHLGLTSKVNCTTVSVKKSWMQSVGARIIRSMQEEVSQSMRLGLRIRPYSSSTYSHYLGTTIQALNSIGQTTIKVTSQEILGSLHTAKTSRTKIQKSLTTQNTLLEPSSNSTIKGRLPYKSQISTANHEQSSTEFCRVYDLLNCGPNRRFQAGPLIVHNCAEHCRAWYNGIWDRPTVFAMPSTSACIRMQQELGKRGIPATIVNAETPRSDRFLIFAAVEAGITALLHINVVSEGVDLKLRRLVDMAPTLSPVKWLQHLGRITRPTDVPPEYWCTNRNILRHAYILEDVLPPSAVLDAQAAFPKSDRQGMTRVLGLEAIGRFKPVPIKLVSGLTAHVYALSIPVGPMVVEYCVLVHPAREAIWATKVNGTKEDGTRAWGSWRKCNAPDDVSGFSSIAPKALSEKQMAWWKRSALGRGLDPEQEVSRKNFQALPVLMDLGARL